MARWPWSKKPDKPISEAERARRAAQQHLDRAVGQRDEVAGVSSRLRDLRERNHFADQIEELWRGSVR